MFLFSSLLGCSPISTHTHSYWIGLWMLTMCFVGRQAGCYAYSHKHTLTHSYRQWRKWGFFLSFFSNSLNFFFFLYSPLQRPAQSLIAAFVDVFEWLFFFCNLFFPFLIGFCVSFASFSCDTKPFRRFRRFRLVNKVNLCSFISGRDIVDFS